MEMQNSKSALAPLFEAANLLAQPSKVSAPDNNNQDYRSKEHAKPESFTAKLVVQHSVKGVKGPVVPSSEYSKSATRFGIDQNLLTLTKIKSTPGLNTGKSSEVYTATVNASEAMYLLDTFDKTFGHQKSKGYVDLENIYNQHKSDLFRTYRITVSKDGKINWPNSEVQDSVLEELRKYSFSHLEIYLSISAKGIRATRSMTLKCLENEGFISAITDIWSEFGFTLKANKSKGD